MTLVPLKDKKFDCSGCRACEEVCPKHCIKMIEDEHGFVYPLVDKETCIDCHLCKKKCPFMLPYGKNNIMKAYVGILGEDEVKRSASGGAFWAMCQLLIPKGYKVVGAKWDEKFQVIHDVAKTEEQAALFRKSKYVMSNTNGVYKKVKDIIRNGGKVMFTGTPCEVAACKKLVGDNPNLLLVDLVCHGAPGQKLFDQEVAYLQDKHKGYLEHFAFRNKRPINGKVNSRSAFYKINGEKRYVQINDDPFLKGYYSRLFYRPSCMKCVFASSQRVGDITIADAWHINQIYSDLDELSGVSLMLANTGKGAELIDTLKTVLNLREVDVAWAIASNKQLQKPTESHKNRDYFFWLMQRHGFADAVEMATSSTLVGKIRGRLFNMFYRKGNGI